MYKTFLYSLLMFMTVAAVNACSEGHAERTAVPEKSIAVTLSTASAGKEEAILASGSVESVQTAQISTRVMGRITNMFVKTGDRVRKGQLLATVSADDIRAKGAQADAMILEAEAGLASARKDYDRFRELFQQQSATSRELDNVTLQYQSAKAKVAAARQMRSEVNAHLSYSHLTAPFSGVVTQKMAEVGSIASPGIPVLTVEQDEVLQVTASIAASDIHQIRPGAPANILIRSTGQRFEGKIVQINPSAQFTGGQYTVKISLPTTKNIYAGMFASISIPVKEMSQAKSDVLLVPLSAIVHREELTGIYTLGADHTAALRWIRLGKVSGDQVEVLSGLAPDETFILSSESKLYNGAAVVVKESADPSPLAEKK